MRNPQEETNLEEKKKGFLIFLPSFGLGVLGFQLLKQDHI